MKCEVPPISIFISMLSAIGVESFFAAAVFINKQNVVKVFLKKVGHDNSNNLFVVVLIKIRNINL